LDVQQERGLRELVAVSAVFFVVAIALRSPQLLGLSGITYPDGRVFGGDFINLWSAGRLVLEHRLDEIYQPAAFQAFEEALAGAGIGLRLWVYSPYSLFLAVPFGLLDFYPAFLLWTVLGLGVLWLGARRFGLGTLESAVILVSPATQLCIDNGQTGNLAAGLLLLALAPKSRRFWIAPLAATILTIKPQLGLLLPVFWALERRWRDIAITSVLVVALVGLGLLVFGRPAWEAYLGQTLPMLSALERYGSGPFTAMIPSVFMSMRILTGNADLALLIHALFAGLIAIVVIWCMARAIDPSLRAGLAMIGTVLITPYIHNYDLNLLCCACVLALRPGPPDTPGTGIAPRVVFYAFMVPILVMYLNVLGVPLSPLLMLPVVFVLWRNSAAASSIAR